MESTSDRPPLAAFLRERREAQGLTQQALADRLSVKQSTVAAWETGQNRPPIDLLVDVAEALAIEDVGEIVRLASPTKRRKADGKSPVSDAPAAASA